MKFCDDHWTKLRAAIEARGIMHLVAKDGETAMQNTIDEANGTADPKAYDPLMSCHWMVSGRAIEMGGLYLMTGDYCPVCEAMKHTAHIPTPTEPDGPPAGPEWVEKHWIDGPADAALDECRRLGLVQGPQ